MITVEAGTSVDPDDPEAKMDVGVRVTGPAARVPGELDLSPTFEKRRARGLVAIDDLVPLAQNGLAAGTDARMRRFPVFSDLLTPVVSGDLGNWTGQLVPGLQHALPVAGDYCYSEALAPERLLYSTRMFGDEAGMRALARRTMDRVDNGEWSPAQRRLMRVAVHESGHEALEAARLVMWASPEVPLFDDLERALSRALGVPSFSFASDDPTAQIELAAQICAYGAVSLPRLRMDQMGATEAFHEVGAEALVLSEEFPDDTPPAAAVITAFMEALHGRSSPVAVEVNQRLYEEAALRQYLFRTSPQALATAWKRVKFTGPYTMIADMEDAGLRWEREHPEQPSDLAVEAYRRAVHQREGRVLAAGAARTELESGDALLRLSDGQLFRELTFEAGLQRRVGEVVTTSLEAATTLGQLARPHVFSGFRPQFGEAGVTAAAVTSEHRARNVDGKPQHLQPSPSTSHEPDADAVQELFAREAARRRSEVPLVVPAGGRRSVRRAATSLAAAPRTTTSEPEVAAAVDESELPSAATTEGRSAVQPARKAVRTVRSRSSDLGR